MSRVVGFVVAVVLVVSALVLLRSATMTRHTPMSPDSRLTVVARARWRGTAAGAPHLARALSLECVAHTSATATRHDFEWDDSGRFRFSVRPALDEADRRQLAGCLADLRQPGLLVDVEQMTVRSEDAT